MAPVKASCYCGDVTFTLDDDEAIAGGGIICHCQTCRALHTNSSYNLKSTQAAIKNLTGKTSSYPDNKANSGKTITRYFCTTCGSALFSFPDSIPGAAFIKVGVLETGKDIPPSAEIYVEQAIPSGVLDKQKWGTKHFEGMLAKEVDY